jgi:hypothetical protein
MPLTIMKKPIDDEADSESAEFFRVYEDYAKNLRTWFVAYGVGAPVLFVSNESVAKRLASSHAAPTIAAYFLAGVALQIALAMINKNAMWACYWSSRYPEEAFKRRFRFAHWISGQYIIDVAIDILTIASFAIATWDAFRIIVAAV